MKRPEQKYFGEVLLEFSNHLIPRILTQVCRDPGNPSYGCFDRNWWHYKIRDFPSIILQQGGYLLHQACFLDDWKSFETPLKSLAIAACSFWKQRALKKGAFEEYYPFEQGYPPLAFSTLAIMKIVNDIPVIKNELKSAAAVAAAQLEKRFEGQAANQQVAGLAAYVWLGKNYPELFDNQVFEKLKYKTLALQHAEGWYVEYDGPDLGYLSVTLDCLWDLFDASNDSDFIASATRALRYMEPYIAVMGESIGMHNSRNTDYIVPYGISRFLEYNNDDCNIAANILCVLFSNIKHDHFLRGIDDRYFCHYTGHSLVRASLVLNNLRNVTHKTQDNDMNDDLKVSSPVFYSGCGHHIIRRSGNQKYSCLVSLRKGGILTAINYNKKICDFGWMIQTGWKTFTTHWWSDQWRFKLIKREKEAIILEVEGFMVPHKEILSDPIKHMMLRLISMLFGSRIIACLKKKMIFKSVSSDIVFRRRLSLFADHIVIVDKISNINAEMKIHKAPRFSKRHVASADSFHAEDFIDDNVSLGATKIIFKEKTFESTVTHRF